MQSTGEEPNYILKQVANSLKKRRKIRTAPLTSSSSSGPRKDDVIFVTNKSGLLAYCHVPKAASTTWMLAFAQMNSLTSNVTEMEELFASGRLHGKMMERYGGLAEDLPSAAFTFTFLRHPFERIVSRIIF
jgi:hypothetical protein